MKLAGPVEAQIIVKDEVIYSYVYVFFYFTNALLIVYTRVASAQDIVECSPRKLRERVTRKPSQSELAAECFEQDFDSKTPSEDIQFKRTWNAKGTSKQSRRRLGLPPAVFNLQKNRKRKPEAYVEHVIEGNVKIYRCPRMGWNSLTRRVIQHGFLLMGSPSQYNDVGNNQWRGPGGAIEQLQSYVGLSGWRSKKVIRGILEKCKQNTAYDAGQREKMQQSRKRKMTQNDVNLATKMLRHGSGIHWATTYVNRQILDSDRGTGSTITPRTLARTMKKSYNAEVHRRQCKKTGSKDKNSVWAQARLALAKQLLVQLRTYMRFCFFIVLEFH